MNGAKVNIFFAPHAKTIKDSGSWIKAPKNHNNRTYGRTSGIKVKNLVGGFCSEKKSFVNISEQKNTRI